MNSRDSLKNPFIFLGKGAECKLVQDILKNQNDLMKSFKKQNAILQQYDRQLHHIENYSEELLKAMQAVWLVQIAEELEKINK